MTEDHLCRAGASCSGRTRKGLDWIPRTTIMPNTVCPRCIQTIQATVDQLWSDYLALHRLFLTPIAHTGSEIRSGEPKSQVPVNVMSDALMNEIADAVYRCAAAIATHLDEPLHETGQLSYWLDIVSGNIDTLIEAPKTEVLTWNRAGDAFGPVMMDGAQLGLALVDLHRRAAAMIGIERPRERMPVPCPRCESFRLGRDITPTGIADINCRSCGSVWTETQYRALTQIGASIVGKGNAQ